MLRGVQNAARSDGDADCVANPRCITRRRTEGLVCLFRVERPDAGARPELGARLLSRRAGHAIARLTGIRCRSAVHVHGTAAVDRERVHRMVAGERESPDDGLRGSRRRHAVRRQRVSDDAIALLGVEHPVVQRDAGATGSTRRRRLAKARSLVGASVVIRVAQRHEKATRGRLCRVVSAAPCIHVDVAIVGDDDVAGVAEAVGEDGCAEARRKGKAAVVAGTGTRRRSAGRCRRSTGRAIGADIAPALTSCCENDA